MQVRDKVGELLVVEVVAEGGHHVSTMQDDRRDAIVVGGRSAGQIALLVKTLKFRAVKALLIIRVVASCAAGMKDRIAAGLLWCKIGKRLGWRRRWFASRCGQHYGHNENRRAISSEGR